MRDDAVDFENLFIRVCLGDVKLPDYSRPVALTTAAAEIRAIREAGSEEGNRKRTIISNVVEQSIISLQLQGTVTHAHIPSKTVCSSDHPGAVHQDPSAHQTTI